MARYRFCIYVDQKCLDTIEPYQAWVAAGSKGNVQRPRPVCAIIAEEVDPEGEGKDGHPSVDGCTRYFPGWMYAAFGAIPGLYNKLTIDGLTDGIREYARPPSVYPPGLGYGMRMPM